MSVVTIVLIAALKGPVLLVAAWLAVGAWNSATVGGGAASGVGVGVGRDAVDSAARPRRADHPRRMVFSDVSRASVILDAGASGGDPVALVPGRSSWSSPAVILRREA